MSAPPRGRSPVTDHSTGETPQRGADTARLPTVPEPWHGRMQRLMLASLEDPAACVPGWESVHRDAVRQRQYRVATASLIYLAWTLRCSGDPHRAETIALRARRLAITHGLPDLAFNASEACAVALHLQGRQAPAIARLCELLDSAEASGVAALARRGAWARLAGFYTDCGAWPLARRALQHAESIKLVGEHACWRWESISRSFAVALPVLMAGHPVFAQALRLPHEEVRSEAEEAKQVCAAAVARIDAAAADAAKAARLPTADAAYNQALARARAMHLLTGAVRGDLSSLDEMAEHPGQMPKGDRSGWWFERLGLAFGCIVAQRSGRALQILQPWDAGPLPSLPPIMFERASYLRFAALQQSGRTEDALAAFQRYAGIAMTRISKLTAERLPLPTALRTASAPTAELPSMALPTYLREVLRVMAADPSRDLSIEDLATSVGVTSRALRTAFRQFLATSPMDHLLKLRLERVHARVTTEAAGTLTLAELASSTGFSSTVRLVALYRERYGRHPLEVS
jgi:AraC-like DNA-binding protein